MRLFYLCLDAFDILRLVYSIHRNVFWIEAEDKLITFPVKTFSIIA